MFQEVLTEEQFFDKYYPGDWRNNFNKKLASEIGANWVCLLETGRLTSILKDGVKYDSIVPYKNNPFLKAYFIQVKEGYLCKEYKTVDGKLWGYIYLREPYPEHFLFEGEDNGYRIFICGDDNLCYKKCFEKEFEAREMLEYLVIIGIEQEDIIAMGFDTY